VPFRSRRRPALKSFPEALPRGVQVHEPRTGQSATDAPILAIVMGTTLDRSVTELATVLADASATSLYVVHPEVAPPALPLVAYGQWFASQGDDSVLAGALAFCPDRVDDAFTLLCREAGPALAAEAAELGCAAVVIGAPQGRWLARWRIRRVVTYLMRHAPCRTYLVHEATPRPLPQAHAAAHR
jgi:nucleotide-binding universal stress UspA family protein